MWKIRDSPPLFGIVPAQTACSLFVGVVVVVVVVVVSQSLVVTTIPIPSIPLQQRTRDTPTTIYHTQRADRQIGR